MFSEKETEIYETAKWKGWSHANYVDAYGGDINHVPPPPVDLEVDLSLWESGWQEGIDNFLQGLFPDGSPREQ